MTESQSRRRRLWELDHGSLCPVIGTCFDVAELRKWAIRFLGLPARATDFQVHVNAVRACEKRTPLAKRLQSELERRFVLDVLRFKEARSTDEVRALWRDAVTRGGVAGGFWAASTHAATDETLSHLLYAEIHMLQHQVAAAQRADIGRLRAAQHENAILACKLAELQDRFFAVRTERDRELQELRNELSATKSRAASFEAAVAASSGELCALREAARAERAAIASAENARTNRLERERAAALAQAEQLEADVQELRAELQRAEFELDRTLASDVVPISAADDKSLVGLGGRAVACVGGRSNLIDRFRRVVERHGGRLLHHDGGQEDSLARLEPVIAAADAVICQAGCVSHNAYWRVKEFCRRTGKPCIFVKTPSITSFLRGLDAITQAA